MNTLNGVVEHRTPHAPAEKRVRRPHRLDLAARGIETCERAAAGDLAVEVRRPEGHAGLTQGIDVEGVHALGRRRGVHPREVLRDQGPRRLAGQIIDMDVEVERFARHETGHEPSVKGGANSGRPFSGSSRRRT